MGGGGKGQSQKPAYTPKYSGMLEDVLTGSALGSMIKQNPASAGFLKPYQGQGMLAGGNSGQGNKGAQKQGQDPYRFGA